MTAAPSEPFPDGNRAVGLDVRVSVSVLLVPFFGQGAPEEFYCHPLIGSRASGGLDNEMGTGQSPAVECLAQRLQNPGLTRAVATVERGDTGPELKGNIAERPGPGS